MLAGNTALGLFLSHCVCCSRTRSKAGITITGVELSTRLRAVSPTASVAAFLLFPKLGGSLPSRSFCSFSSGLNTGYISMPRRISSPRIRNTFRAPAEATAVKGTRRANIVLVLGDNRFRRGTAALSPKATEHEAETARTYDLTMVLVDRGLDLLALAWLIPTLRDWLAICHSMVPVV